MPQGKPKRGPTAVIDNSIQRIHSEFVNFFSSRLGPISPLVVMAFALAGCQTPRPASETSTQVSVPAAAVPTTKILQAAITPQQALAELRAGNERFVSAQPKIRHPAADIKEAASGQYPFAVVLSCIDSRQPIELVLDQGIGDIFSARVAGNVLDDDILGSMEFACKVSGAKLIAVIGHSNCGAIKGAVDHVELGSLTGLLARIKPALDQIPNSGQPRNSKNAEFVSEVANANVRLVMQQIRERSPILREMLDKRQISLVGGMYDLSTGKINFYDN